jgi:hypothetical protein
LCLFEGDAAYAGLFFQLALCAPQEVFADVEEASRQSPATGEGLGPTPDEEQLELRVQDREDNDVGSDGRVRVTVAVAERIHGDT